MKLLRLSLLFGLGILLLASCKAKPAPITPATETPVTATRTISIPTQPIAMEQVEDNCVTCHTDKEMLINTTAVAEESHESESEGVG